MSVFDVEAVCATFVNDVPAVIVQEVQGMYAVPTSNEVAVDGVAVPDECEPVVEPLAEFLIPLSTLVTPDTSTAAKAWSVIAPV